VAYNNNSNKSTFVKKTGQEVINNDYKINYSSLINPDDRLSSSVNDQDEIVVVRKFDSSTIADGQYTHNSYPVLATEAWSAWTLPNTNSSGSSMYTLNSVSKEITFKTTTSSGEYDWTTLQSGREAVITLPTLSSSDTIYVLRKTYGLTKLVEFTSGSRINADNLNYIIDQLLFLVQEGTDMMYNLQEWSPMIGQPNGLVTLDATGSIPNSYTNVLAEDGIQGTGLSTDKIRLNLADDSLAISGEAVKVSVVDSLVSTSVTQPLSANQGKTLKGEIDALSAGVVYRGVIDLHPNGASTAAPTSPVAGDTHDIIRSSGSGAFTMTNFNNLSLEAGDIIRYSGSSWVKTAQASTLRSDGTVGLSADWNAGTHSITAKTEDATESSAKLASTAFVKSVDLADFADVTDYGSGTNTHVLKRVSGAWVSTSVGDASNGFSLHDLKDVHTAASDGQFLKWNNADSRWEGASTGASAKIAEPASGTADGATDDQSSVSTVLNAVGIVGGTNSTSSIFGSADLLGRHYAVNSKVETFTKNDVQWRHGKLNWTKADSDGTAANGTLLGCPTETNVSTFLASPSVTTGDYNITLGSGTNFAKGDLIQIFTTSDSSSNNVLGLRNGKVHQFELHYIETISGAEVRLRDPLLHDYTHGSDATHTTIKKLGSASNATQQPHDIILEDLVFEDTLHKWETVTNSSISFNEGSFGSQVIKTAWASNGVADNAKVTFTGLMVDDDNTESKWTVGAVPEWDWLNGKTMPVTFDKGVATLTASDGDAAVTTGAVGTTSDEITLISTDGTQRKYFITDTAAGGVATGTVLAEGSDIGSTTAGAGNVGKIAVGINTTGGSIATQNALLIQLKAAIEHANGHNGKIIVSAVPTEADGTQAITITQAVGGDAGNTTITETLDDVSKSGSTFTGGVSNAFNASFIGNGAGAFRAGATGQADNTGTILGILGASVGVHIENGYRISFKRCRFKGFGLGQVKLTGCRDVSFNDCLFEDMKWTGTEGNAVVLKNCADISFKNCTFRNVSHGIAYDGAAGYTAVSGLTIDSCKFRGVTSGVRDINNGVCWDVNVMNTSVDCVAFNPYRNYPIADEVVSYPTTGMKLVGLKINVDNFVCDSRTKWSEVAPTETSASEKQTDYYGTGKGWSTRWTANSYNNFAGNSISGRRHPSTAFGLKVVTFGRFDLVTKEGEELWVNYNALNPELNSCQAVKITNSVIDAWLCGIHISTEVGLGTGPTDYANQNITQGIKISENKLQSMCNALTVYGGKDTNAGVENMEISNNFIEISKSGTLARFPGVRKLQALTGTSRAGNVVNCALPSEFAEGPATPQYPHCIRIWCDIKGDFTEPDESGARLVRNDNIKISDNQMVTWSLAPLSVKSEEHETGLIRMQGMSFTSANATTNRELIVPHSGLFIIWGAKAGGEAFMHFKTFGARPLWSDHRKKVNNTNNCQVVSNTFNAKAHGNRRHQGSMFFQQFGPFVKGLTASHDTFYQSTFYRQSGSYNPLGNSIITKNISMHHRGYFGSDAVDGFYAGNEPVVTVGAAKTVYLDTVEYINSENPQDGPYFQQNLGWSYNRGGDNSSSNNGSYASYNALRDYFHGNWCGDNNTILSEYYATYHNDSAYYHAANVVTPID